jgi:rhodanese-related sulfurtransferase
MQTTPRRADEVTPEDRVIDVRMGWEFHRGHIPGACHLGLLRALAGPRLPDSSIVVCESGHRAAVVAARRGGTGARWVLAATAATWVVGAVADHAGDLGAEHVRSGVPSRTLIVGIIVTQTVVLALVVVSLRRSAPVVSSPPGTG